MSSQDVRAHAEALLGEQGSFSSGQLSARTGLTRQGLHHHITGWLAEGWLVREGGGRSTRYLVSCEEPRFDRRYPSRGLEEETVRRDVVAWIEEAGIERTEAGRRVLDYVLTETVNNAVDHSGAPEVRVRWERVGDTLMGEVADEGIGAFERIRSVHGFEDHLVALQELSKGKLTTQPEAHSGEGLFFASKMVARFELEANGLVWVVDNEIEDQTVRETAEGPGTRVRTTVSSKSSPDPIEVFERYTTDLEFDATTCVVRLFQHGKEFVSRSEAKRIVHRLDQFREVEFDFTGVESVGQGFVDEVFRVWANAHPQVRIRASGMARPVEFMVRRGWPGWRSSGLDTER